MRLINLKEFSEEELILVKKELKIAKNETDKLIKKIGKYETLIDEIKKFDEKFSIANKNLESEVTKLSDEIKKFDEKFSIANNNLESEVTKLSEVINDNEIKIINIKLSDKESKSRIASIEKRTIQNYKFMKKFNK